MPNHADLTDQGDATFSFRINQWLDALTADFNGRSPNSSHGISFFCDTPGKKFVRIIQADSDGRARSVHAFYDIRTGDVYKAAGWKAPAKHVRFNLLDDASFRRMIETCDWSGRYLYLR